MCVLNNTNYLGNMGFDRFTLVRMRRRVLSFLPVIRPIMAVIVLAGLIYGSYIFVWPLMRLAREIMRTPINVFSLVRGDINLAYFQNRTNILLLGAGGQGHEGPDLTDSMMLVSVKIKKEKEQTDKKTNQIVVVSIPRDIWLESLRAKINSAYYYGEQKRPGGGLILAKAAVAEIFNLPVHYAVKLDFGGFEKMIDLMGGIEIEVEKTLDDYYYPAAGKETDLCEDEDEQNLDSRLGGLEEKYKCRFEHIYIVQGRQLMDGQLALKYSRSRYADGEEGSDFSRSRRQQRVLLALKDKIFTPKTLLNTNKIKELMAVLDKSIETDIKSEEIDDFVNLALRLKHGQIKTLVLDTDDEETGHQGLLVNPPLDEYGGHWILLPKNNDWTLVREYVKKELE